MLKWPPRSHLLIQGKLEHRIDVERYLRTFFNSPVNKMLEMEANKSVSDVVHGLNAKQRDLRGDGQLYEHEQARLALDVLAQSYRRQAGIGFGYDVVNCSKLFKNKYNMVALAHLFKAIHPWEVRDSMIFTMEDHATNTYWIIFHGQELDVPRLKREVSEMHAHALPADQRFTGTFKDEQELQGLGMSRVGIVDATGTLYLPVETPYDKYMAYGTFWNVDFVYSRKQLKHLLPASIAKDWKQTGNE